MLMRCNIFEVRQTEIQHDTAIIDLLSLAAGGGQLRTVRVLKRYPDDPAAVLLAAVSEGRTVGVAGYVVSEAEATLLHIATAPHSQRTGVGTCLLQAVTLATSGVAIVAETDDDALSFYEANGFAITPLGEKYPGVKRYRVRRLPPIDVRPESRKSDT